MDKKYKLTKKTIIPQATKRIRIYSIYKGDLQKKCSLKMLHKTPMVYLMQFWVNFNTIYNDQVLVQSTRLKLFI